MAKVILPVQKCTESASAVHRVIDAEALMHRGGSRLSLFAVAVWPIFLQGVVSQKLG